MTLEMFVKSDEWFLHSKGEDKFTRSNRSRNITNPSMTIKAIGGHLNWIMM